MLKKIGFIFGSYVATVAIMLLVMGRFGDATTAVYNETVRIVDSAGNVINGTASATSANYNATVRVVDSTGKVIDSFGGTPAPTASPVTFPGPAFTGPFIGGKTENWTGAATQTVPIPSAVASPDTLALVVVAQSTLSATPCAVASPGVWTQRAAINGGTTNNEFLCTAPASGLTSPITVKDATGTFVPALYDLKKNGGTPAFDQAAGQLLASNPCPSINAALITPTQNNNLTMLMMDNVNQNAASYITSTIPMANNFSAVNPPNQALVLEDITPINTSTRHETTFAYYQLTAAAWPAMIVCNEQLGSNANGAALMADFN